MVWALNTVPLPVIRRRRLAKLSRHFQRGIEARLLQLRFPRIKTLEQLDFDFPPSLNWRQVRE